MWMRDHGEKLFDVLSEAAMVKAMTEGLCFDSEFYEDQKDPSQRKLVIETVRVRKEFVEAEKQCSATKARKFARKLSALGQSPVVREFCENLPEAEVEDDEVLRSPFKTPREAVSCTSRSNIITRKAKRTLYDAIDCNENILHIPSVANTLGTLSNQSTQTESHCLDDICIPAVSTRKKATRSYTLQPVS